MRRASWMFASGPVGLGLLLLRLALMLCLVFDGLTGLPAGLSTGRGLEGVAPAVLIPLLLVGGVLIGTGFLTPIVEIVVAVVQLGMLSDWVWTLGSSGLERTWQSPFLQASIAAALALIGPGAYSVDARRFGRKEINVRARSENRRQ